MSDHLEAELHELLVRRAATVSCALDGPAIRAMAAARTRGDLRRTAGPSGGLLRPLLAAAVIIAALAAISFALIAGAHPRHAPAIGPVPAVSSTVQRRPVTVSPPVRTATASTAPTDDPLGTPASPPTPAPTPAPTRSPNADR